MPTHILVAERDDDLRETIGLHLNLEGFTCVSVADAQSAADLATTQRFDLIVMDAGLPPAGGLHLSRVLRGQHSHRHTPIVLVTTPTLEPEALLALEHYTDDYMVKPFGIRELVARVRGLIRRSRRAAAPLDPLPAPAPALVRTRVVIDPARRRVDVDGRAVRLTEQEFQLLYVLVGGNGTVFSRETLLGEVWGKNTFVTVRSVDTLVKRLRKRLKAAHRMPPRVLTVRGVGYKFESTP
jgi:DNA-binding response OmpR family regulator